MIEQYYRENYNKQVKLVSRILNNDYASAEDVVQESYCRALKYSETFEKSKGDFEKWFNSILFNCLSNLKSEGRSVIKEPIHRHYDIEWEPMFPSILENLNLVSGEIDLEKKRDKKQILDCFFLKGYTAKEIRYTIGYSETKVWKVCSEFRKKLKEKFNVNV